MTDEVFWRVLDDDSRANWDDDGNVVAGGTDDKITFTWKTVRQRNHLKTEMYGQLDWKHPIDTPFISVYGSKGFRWALREARRRVDAGRTNVALVKIIIPHRPVSDVQYRWVPKLMKALGGRVPLKAKHNATYEFVFLRRIPAEFIKWVKHFE